MFLQERTKSQIRLDSDCGSVTQGDETVTLRDAGVTKSDNVTADVTTSKSTNPFETEFDAFPAELSDQFSVKSVFSVETNHESQKDVPKFPFVHTDSRDSVYENGTGNEKSADVSP